MDFVVGYEIKLSHSHEVTDICDSAQGKYPKDFVFTGWHPNCMCYVIPILKTEEEFWSEDRTTPSVNEVTTTPNGFNQWVFDNQERIASYEQHGTTPYWMAANKTYVEEGATAFLSNAMSESDFIIDGFTEISVDDRRFMNSVFNEIHRKTNIFSHGEYLSTCSESDSTLMLWTNDCVRVSRARYVLSDGSIFAPAEELLSAFKKLKAGQAMTLKEEYMIESLYHESVHSMAGDALLKVEHLTKRLVETTTQLYARAKYRTILDAFGVDAVNYETIQIHGFGYRSECNAIRRIFTENGVLQLDELRSYAKCEKSIYDFIDKLKRLGNSSDEIREIMHAFIHH